jgi:hypothetical protein
MIRDSIKAAGRYGAQSKTTLFSVVGVFLGITMFLLPPGLLGTNQGIGVTLLSIILLAILLPSLVASWLPQDTKAVVITILLSLWILFQMSFYGNVSIEEFKLAGGAITGILIGLFGAKAVSAVGSSEQVFKILIWGCALLSASAIISFLVGSVAGWDAIHVANFSLKSSGNGKDFGFDDWSLYYPVTVTEGSTQFGNQEIPRACGLFREPGIFQMFLVTSFFSIDFIRVKWPQLIKALLFGGILLTFSTIGVPVFFALLIYRSVMQRRATRKIIALALSTSLSVIIFLSVGDSLGISRKLDPVHGTDNRSAGIIDSMTAVADHPIMGYGITNRINVIVRKEEAIEGVCLFASIHRFGLVGLLLYLAILSIALRRYSWASLPVIAPVVATICVAQPIYFSASVFFLLFSPLHTLGGLPIYGSRRFIAKRPLVIADAAHLRLRSSR